MRVLMTLALSVCVGTLIGLLPIPCLVLSAGLILAGILTVALFKSRVLRLSLILFGVGAGILWGYGFSLRVMEPTAELSWKELPIFAEAVSYSRESKWGSNVEAEISAGGYEIRGTVYLKEHNELSPGDTFSVTAKLMDSYALTESLYGRSEGNWLVAQAVEEGTFTPCAEMPLKYWPKAVAKNLGNILRDSLPADIAGFGPALIVGDRQDMTDADIMALKLSGGYHMLALSGMHMAVLVGILGLVIRKKRWIGFLGIPGCILFTVVTGAGASIARACVMECMLLLAPMFRREADGPTNLSLAALILMLLNPWCVFGWGMQLSFLSVLGLMCFGGRFYKLLTPGKIKRKALRRIRNVLAASLSASMAVGITSVPLLGYYGGYVSVLYPLTALLLTPVVSGCFGLGLGTAILGLGLPRVSAGLGWILGWGFRYVRLASGVVSRVPLTVLATDSAYGVCCLLIFYGILLLFLVRPKCPKVIPLCCGAVGYGVCILLILLEGAKPGFTAIDVGQGQSLLLRAGGETVLVDCGGNRGNAGDFTALELMKQGEHKVDLLILTHFDSDHVNGVEELLERIEVSRLIVPDYDHENRQSLEEAAFAHGVTVYHCKEDTTVNLRSGTLQILPAQGGSTDNNQGLSVFASMAEMEVLITGDMNTQGEEQLLHRYEFPNVDILIAGHHGSKTSTGDALLKKVKPETVIISVGENRYGHPAEETVERILSAGARLFRTDINDTVTIRGGA